jgi:hypothetical protein
MNELLDGRMNIELTGSLQELSEFSKCDDFSARKFAHSNGPGDHLQWLTSRIGITPLDRTWKDEISHWKFQ